MIALWMSLCWADPAHVVTELADQVVIDWTDEVLRVEASAVQQGVDASQKAAEQLARQQVGPRVLQGVRGVPITHELDFAALTDDPELGPSLRSRVAEWVVTETRYHTSGRVALTGELSLQGLIKPWVWGRARPAPSEVIEAGFTGILVDARGLSLQPAYAPRLLTPDQQVLWEGVLLEEHALDTTPAGWVTDPADPVTARVGDSPLWLFPKRADGADLTLTLAEADALRAALGGTTLGARGDVVLVVDP